MQRRVYGCIRNNLVSTCTGLPFLVFFDVAVNSFFLFGGGGCVGGAGAAAATAVVASSTGGEGGFNFREEFIDFAVLGVGGPRDMVERSLYDLVTMCCCVHQVVEVGVQIIRQIRALGENAGFSVEWGGVVFGDNVVYQLGGGYRSERILLPCKACFAMEVLVEGVEGVLPGPPRLVILRLTVPLRAVIGKGVRKEEG